MKRAWLNLRLTVPERARAFRAGLQRLGYHVEIGTTQEPGADDILVTWNRIHDGQTAAQAFEARALPVLVAENATWSNGFLGGAWYHIARNWHNTAGRFPVGGHVRWDALNVPLMPWRTYGETVILPQRGIGAAPVAMPVNWPRSVAHLGRTRPHPGQRTAVSLRDDLASAGRVLTWGSGAAVQALMWGIPVESQMPGWIGEQDNTDEGRLRMLRRLAWAQWRLSEIESGETFARLLP